MKKWPLVLVAAASAALVSFACSSSDESAGCADGDRQQCTCAGGGTGTATCSNGAFGACVCATTSTSSSSSTGGTGGQEGGLPTIDAGFGNYLGACQKTEDCPDGGQCFTFGTKGMICTHACTMDDQCEAPSPKCNPRGLCAVPD